MDYCRSGDLFLSNMTTAEENYLKAIYKLSKSGDLVSTNNIASQMSTSAASVTDMIKRLAEKNMVIYEKYKGVELSDQGRLKATQMIRNHRLWEVFLVEKLSFTWDEVNDIAEQLEHIKSPDLIKRLEEFLGHPSFDPHGDPIPDSKGQMKRRSETTLAEVVVGTTSIVVGVKDTSSPFLQYLNKLKIGLGSTVEVIDKLEFDGSMELRYDQGSITISQMVAQNLFVKSL